MKTFRFRFVQVLSVLVVVTGVAVLATRSGRGQSPAAAKTESQNPKPETLVKPTILATDRPAMKEAALAPFAEAAAQNALLRTDLSWTFGSKQQQGWYLYDLLIGQTLNISHGASTDNFAS